MKAYEPPKVVEWSYCGECGVQHWAKHFPLAREGKEQSPIDISDVLSDQNLPQLNLNYQPIPFHATHTGNTISMAISNHQAITFGKIDYVLQEFHFHAPSDHTVNQESFDLEAHFVHKNANGNLLVLGVFFRVGEASNQALKHLFDHIPLAPQEIKKDESMFVDINQLFPENKDYYSYQGSLTVPPCTEGVSWVVFRDVLSMSQDTLNQYKQAIPFNSNRPIQPLNGRTIFNKG